jgi:hypothetical protein
MKFHILFLALILFQLSCELDQDSPVFKVPGNGSNQIEQRLVPDESGRYLFEQPLLIIEGDQAFSLRFRGDGAGATVRLLGEGNREIAAKDLPGGSEATVYLPLLPGNTLAGFQIDPPTGEQLQLLEAGITKPLSGMENTGRYLSLGTAVRRMARDGPALELLLTDPESWSAGSSATEAAASAPPAGWQITLVLETRPPFSTADFRLRESYAGPPDHSSEPVSFRATVLISFGSGDRIVSFRHTALSGRHTLFFYSGMVPFDPVLLRIEPLGGCGVWLERLDVARLPSCAAGGPAGKVSPTRPLPADPGGVLLYDTAAWRNSEYELFSWNRFPEILIMDTASYEVQSRFFKRLAFFVEKRGYRGRLVTNREFAGLHGFNAHDYRAEDLAVFYQTARERLFTLNPEEELLKEILLDNGVIRDDGIFTPGKGGSCRYPATLTLFRGGSS